MGVPAAACSGAGDRGPHRLDLGREQGLPRTEPVEHDQGKDRGDQEEKRPAPRAAGRSTPIDL